jgi:Phospholipase D C terminal
MQGHRHHCTPVCNCAHVKVQLLFIKHAAQCLHRQTEIDRPCCYVDWAFSCLPCSHSAPCRQQENWAAYTSDKVQRLPHGHLLLYPIEVLARPLCCFQLHQQTPVNAAGRPTLRERVVFAAVPAVERLAVAAIAPK